MPISSYMYLDLTLGQNNIIYIARSEVAREIGSS